MRDNEEYLKIQDLTKEYCPGLYDFIGISQPEWDKINSRSDKRLKFLEAKIKLNGKWEYETNLFDVFIQIRQGIPVAKYFVQFIDEIISTIKKTTPHCFHNKLKMRAYDIVANFDNTRSNYLDPIGEFVALISILKESSAILNSIEYKMPNGKHADYLFTLQGDEDSYLVDVLNINIKEGRIKEKNDLITFLTKRIEDKLNDKLKKMQGDDIPYKFSLLPVVWFWFNINEFSDFDACFLEIEKKYNLSPFRIITQSRNENKDYKFYYYSIKETFEINKL